MRKIRLAVGEAKALGALIAVLALGVVLGVILAEKRTRRNSPVAKTERPSAPDPEFTDALQAPKLPENKDASGPVAGRVDSERPQESPIQPSGRTLAEEIWKLLSRRMEDDHAFETGTADAYRVMGRLPELTEAEAVYFLERYRESNDRQKREMALVLAVACGGADVPAFLAGRLRDPALTQEEKELVFRKFSEGPVSYLRPDKPLVLTDELGNLALGFLDSPDMVDRMGGAGLLGGYPNPIALSRLRQAAAADPEPTVRAAAIWSLGRVGDRDTLSYLKSYVISLPPSDNPNPKWILERALREAVWRLEKRFPN